jgi:hypothetical protein
MTAGRVGASGLEVPRRGVRLPRRAVLGSAIAIVGSAVVLAAAVLVGTSGRQPTTVPARAPAVAVPAATAPAEAVPAVTPTATVGAPVFVVPQVSGPTGPGRVPADGAPGRRWPVRSWGLYVD